MLIKILLFAILSLSFYITAYSEELSTKREKVIILPFRNESDTKQYANSGIFMEVSSSNIEAFSDRQKARIVIYGRYSFSGDKSNPKIAAMLTAYDGAGRTN